MNIEDLLDPIHESNLIGKSIKKFLDLGWLKSYQNIDEIHHFQLHILIENELLDRVFRDANAENDTFDYIVRDISSTPLVSDVLNTFNRCGYFAEAVNPSMSVKYDENNKCEMWLHFHLIVRPD